MRYCDYIFPVHCFRHGSSHSIVSMKSVSLFPISRRILSFVLVAVHRHIDTVCSTTSQTHTHRPNNFKHNLTRNTIRRQGPLLWSTVKNEFKNAKSTHAFRGNINQIFCHFTSNHLFCSYY